MKVEEFCRLDENCIFTAPKEFATLNVAGGAALGNLVVRNTINGVKAAEFVEDTMLYSGKSISYLDVSDVECGELCLCAYTSAVGSPPGT